MVPLIKYVTHYDFWSELGLIVKYGEIELSQAIDLATRGNAEILDIQSKTGSICVDKEADIILLKNDLLKSLS